MPEDDDDTRAAGLVDWLRSQGYSAAAAAGQPDANRATRLVRGTCQVTVSRDRGQWFVEAGPVDVEGFDMSLWEAYLRDMQPTVEAAEFADEERMLRNTLHEIERTLVLDDEALRRLQALRTWREEVRWSSPSA